MSIVAYMRVSTEEQRERQTIAMQREQLERHKIKHDLHIDDWYADDGISGTLMIDQRPEGRRLIADARAGRVNRLLIYKLDRLGRDALVTLSAIDALDQCGIEIVSITQNLDLKTPHGRFMAVIDCGITGYERDTLVERSVDGARRIAREGGWLGGRPPYGYRLSGTGRTARLVPSDVVLPHAGLSEADVVREMYRRLVAERASCLVIADWLNESGIPTSRMTEGSRTLVRWCAARVGQVFACTTYKGIHQYGKDGRRGSEIIEREVPPLVSVEMWEAARHRLAENRRTSSRNTKQEYLLRGLMRCECGATYVGSWKHRASGSYLYYYCYGHMHYRATGSRGDRCMARPINGRDLEARIWADLEAWAESPQSLIDRVWSELSANTDDMIAINAELRKVQKAIDATKGERDSILTLYRKGRINEAMLDTQFDAIAAEEARLEERANRLRSRAHAAEDLAGKFQELNNILADLDAYIANADTFAKRRHIIESCIASITVRTVDGAATPEIAYRFDRLAPPPAYPDGEESSPTVIASGKRRYNSFPLLTVRYPAIAI